VEDYEQEIRNIFSGANISHYLLALSAKTESALQERIQDLTKVLKEDHCRWDEQGLQRLSYTLANHRQHFAYRCALIVSDRTHAISMLEQITGTERQPNVFKGKTTRDFVAQPLMLEYGQDLLKQLDTLNDNPHRYQQSLSALADLYCQGYSLSWTNLYADPPLRMSLPTYPFAQTKHWLPKPLGHGPVDSRKATLDVGTFSQLLDDLVERRLSVDDALERVLN